ncbi:MAG: GNAT family N-acetyltransferase [Eubacteriales bacterium]
MLITISDVTYKGRTPQEDYQKLLDFLNDVFFIDDDIETKRDFLGLLPKLYKPEYDPCYSNFIVKEGDDIKGAVGLYYNEIMAGGEKLRCGGIGNVAVAKDSRSKGYMIECMNMAMADMKESKADFGLLGGQRQRYGYFGFEPAGVRYDFSINLSNLRHCFGNDAENELEVREVTAGDTEVLAEIDNILRKEAYYAIHPPEQMFDILCSWRNKPYAAFKDGVIKGFFTRDFGGGLSSFKSVDAQSINQMILAVFETVQDKNIGFSVAPYDTDCLDHFTKIAESCSIRHPECYTVINFANTVRGLLKVKAATEPITDGEIKLFIHGNAGDEKIKVSIKAGKVTVEATEETPEFGA